MSASDRYKEAKAKRERGGFVPLPYAVLRSTSWARLSGNAVKLLIDLLAQYKGDNNGDFCMAWKTIINVAGAHATRSAKLDVNCLRKAGSS